MFLDVLGINNFRNIKDNNMCTVSVKVNEALLRGMRPELNSTAAIRQWAQEIVDSRLKEMQAVLNQEFVEVDINSL